MISEDKPKGSRTAKVTKAIGDDYYDLKLDFEGIVELEEKAERGAYFIYLKMAALNATQTDLEGDFRVKWIADVIRIGLIRSGAMTAPNAINFVEQHLRGGFIMDYLQAAIDVLYAAIYGPEDEPVVFEKSGEPKPEVSPTPSADTNGANTGSSPEPSA
nr:GTA-gp10 family protein [uncultured Brevundimonas sp.]